MKKTVLIAIGSMMAGMFLICAACTSAVRQKTVSNQIVAGSRQESIDPPKPGHFVIRKLISAPDAPAGQKEVTNQDDIQRIVGYIAAAPKTHPTVYDNAPGTLFTIACPELQYAAALYRGNVLYYGGSYYQMEPEFTENLLRIFENIDAPRTDIQ